MKRFILLFAIICCSEELFAQQVIVKQFTVVGEDTIILSSVPEVEILAFKNREEKLQYFILKRKVLKVYPYALEAKKKLAEMEIALEKMPKKKQKKKYAKEVAIWIKDEYSEQLKNLTMSEGRILVKLIYRETKITSYDLVKSYRGTFNAIFWQTMAKLWENNLKMEYDPINNQEDMLIEHIIIQSKLSGTL